MKLFLTSLVFVVCFTGFSQAIIEFEKTEHDFGKVDEQAGKVLCEFEFKNTGYAPLLILDVQASCGCTVPNWTKSPILPNKTGIIKAEFDPKGRVGIIDKTLTVKVNTLPEEVKLKLVGEVLEIGELNDDTQSE